MFSKYSKVLITLLFFLSLPSFAFASIAGSLSALGQLGSLSGILPFGGNIKFVRPCLTPFGAFQITLSGPTPGFYMYEPGVSQTYWYGPPIIPTQWTLGNSLPPAPLCDVGLDSPPVQLMTMEGSSLPGGGGGGAPSKPAANALCPQSGFDITNSIGKRQAEVAVRAQLSSENITVNKDLCSVGVSFQKTSGGCTDVSGLQCNAMTDLKNLSQTCQAFGGGFQITAGSEGGHSTHSAGNAVDISSNGSAFNNSISQCIESKFSACGSKLGGKIFCDPSTGTTFWQEFPGATAHNTGAHWHVCFGGKGC